MIIDGDGKLTGKPRNERATRLANFPTPAEHTAMLLRLQALGIPVISAGEKIDDRSTETDYIAGDALVCADNELL